MSVPRRREVQERTLMPSRSPTGAVPNWVSTRTRRGRGFRLSGTPACGTPWPAPPPPPNPSQASFTLPPVYLPSPDAAKRRK